MKLHIEQEINASADKVWEIMGHRFGQIGDWAPGVKWSRVLEAGEVPADYKVDPSAPIPGRATPNPLGELKEILVKYSEANKEFTFQVAGLPSIVTYSENTTRVIDKGPNQCLVTSDIEMRLKSLFKLLEPILQKRLATSSAGPAGLLEALKPYAETGQLSEKK